MRPSNHDSGHAAGTVVHDAVAVQSQVARLIASPHFRNSKRSQALLRFVVDAALAGDPPSLKERSIGVSVFGRETAYDTAQDPIVRNAAIEVRKRLAQYYLEPEHANELRIELPIGSYSPTFAAETAVPSPENPAVSPEPPVTVQAPHRRRLWWIAAAVGVGLILLIATTAILWNGRRTAAAELDAFWEPLFRDAKPIQICVGQPTRLYRFVGPRMEELNQLLATPASPGRNNGSLSIAPGEVAWVAPEYVFLRDALSGFNLASWIQSKGRPYRLISVSQTNYSQLRHAPLVAIGAFNNTWSMRVTAELPFVFDHRTLAGITYNSIRDQRNPGSTDWKVAQPADVSMTDDYAIVTRVFDPDTEKTVISAAGIETYGTLAASEFVTHAEYLGAALQAAPRDWPRKNVQFVLGTKIIDGTPGPPRILAAHFW